METARRVATGAGAGPRPHLNLNTRLLYSVGEIALDVKTALFGLYTLFLYTSVMGLPGTLVGIASALGLVWDAVIDPYIGQLSDRTRLVWGRRHGLMLVGGLTMGLSLWAFFSPPQGLSTTALFVWLLFANLAVRTTTSVFGVPYLALGAELSQDYHERTAIAGLRGFMALLGTLAAAALSFLLFFPDQGTGVDPKLNYGGYPAMGITFGLLMTAVGLIATFGTRSWIPFLPKAAGVDSTQAVGNVLSGFAQCLRNPSFRVLFLSISLFFLGVVVNTSLSIHYLTYYVQISDSRALASFQGALYGGGLVGVLLWLRVSRWVPKHWLYLISTAAAALVMISAYLFVGEGRLFGVGNVVAMLVGHAIGGIFISILWFIPSSMIADVADEDELVTGQRREGAFFGVFLFGQQVAAGLSVLVTGSLIDLFAGLVPGQASQSAETVARIGLLYGVLPALLLAAAALLILRYQISRARLLAVRAELQRRRAVGRAEPA